MLYNRILEKQSKEKMLVLLFDPDKTNEKTLGDIVKRADRAGFDFFLMGGSLISKGVNENIATIKKASPKPVFLFPGNLLQLCDQADGILLLSLISGRNPDFLIGNHVNAAQFLKRSKLEIVPTGYMLIETGRRSSVEYMSYTIPIPGNKPDIAVATAIAGEMLGLKLIYLEGGSGSDGPINNEIISAVKKNISIPLMVGGGIRSAEAVRQAYDAGADIVVIGSAVEENPSIIEELSKAKHDQ